MTDDSLRGHRMRAVGVFVTVTGLAVDALLLGASLIVGPSAGSEQSLLDLWGLAQTVLAVVGLAVIAWRSRSLGWGILAGVFTLIAFQDGLSWHGGLGSRLASVLDLTGLTRVVGASTSAWGSFLILSGTAVLGGIAVLVTRRGHTSLRRPAAVFGALLAALFLFAAVVNLWGSASPHPFLGWLEEVGEAAVLSLVLGYVSSLMALGRGWSDAVERRAGGA